MVEIAKQVRGAIDRNSILSIDSLQNGVGVRTVCRYLVRKFHNDRAAMFRVKSEGNDSRAGIRQVQSLLHELNIPIGELGYMAHLDSVVCRALSEAVTSLDIRLLVVRYADHCAPSFITSLYDLLDQRADDGQPFGIVLASSGKRLNLPNHGGGLTSRFIGRHTIFPLKEKDAMGAIAALLPEARELQRAYVAKNEDAVAFAKRLMKHTKGLWRAIENVRAAKRSFFENKPLDVKLLDDIAELVDPERNFELIS